MPRSGARAHFASGSLCWRNGTDGFEIEPSGRAEAGRDPLRHSREFQPEGERFADSTFLLARHHIFGRSLWDLSLMAQAQNEGKVLIQPHQDTNHCDVVVQFRGQELVYNCPDYDTAVKWARIECKSYRLPAEFTEKRPATSS
jgi:hypothetical protein